MNMQRCVEREKEDVPCLQNPPSSIGLWKPLPITLHSPKRPASLKTSPESSSPPIRKKHGRGNPPPRESLDAKRPKHFRTPKFSQARRPLSDELQKDQFT